MSCVRCEAKHESSYSIIFVDEVCGLFKLAGIPDDVVKKKVFPLSLRGDASTWYRVCDDMRSWNYIRSFIICILFIMIAIIYIIFGLAMEKASLKLGVA